MHENREILRVPRDAVSLGRMEKASPPTSIMHARRKSDEGVVLMKSRNNADETVAVAAEGRPETKGNPNQPMGTGAQTPGIPASGLERVRMAAMRNGRKQRFTGLLHHVTEGFLAECYWGLNPTASPGVDRTTWQEYGEDLRNRLSDLNRRVHTGTYRAQPSRRVWIPKPDGRQRPLGVAALEDKIVQRAIGRILEVIYEVDFKGLSYGFRPGRGQHDALDSLWTALMTKPVNWVVDADIQGFFDALDHEWLMKFVEHRIGDPRILRLIRQWLRCGVCENGRWTGTTQGVPQGAVISPLLANIYLHYVLDTWFTWWRRTRNNVIMVRYADDFVVGFQHHSDAKQFLTELKARLDTFGLKLHPDKTRLIEFGRFAQANRRRRQEGRPETFNFLGFTHIAGTRRSDGQYAVHRHTIAKRMHAKVADLKATLKRIRERTIKEQGTWLGSVVRGWLNYHAIPTNSIALSRFRSLAIDAWRRSLLSRSQTAGRTIIWNYMRRLADRFIPPARILHPYPNQRHAATT